MLTDVLFSGWGSLLRVLIMAVSAYAALVLMLRLVGKRALAKMSAFDLVVTVAMGSVLGSAATNQNVTLVNVLAAYAVLLGLQYLVSFGIQRLDWFERLVKAEPTLLLHRGELLHSALREERISEAELLQAVRLQGIGSLKQAAAVVLETDGTFTVIAGADDGELPALRNVRRPEAKK
ncbi:MAG: DUF421 domain-containing protein [Armatimonadota bacterium]